MKKLITAFVLIMTITSTAKAQNVNDYAGSYNLKKNNAVNKNKNLPGGSTGTTGVLKNKFALKATAEFAKFDVQKNNIVWDTIAGGGFIACYKINQNNGRRYYNKKGHFLCNILTVELKDLPGISKTDINSTYPGYNVTSVQEFTMPSKTFYIIHIENTNNHKELMVTKEGDIEIIRENFN